MTRFCSCCSLGTTRCVCVALEHGCGAYTWLLSSPLIASHCRFLVTPIPACCVLACRASPLRTSCMDQTELGWIAVRYHLLFTAVLPAHLVPFPLLCLSWDPHPLLQWHYRDWFPGKESHVYLFAKKTLHSLHLLPWPQPSAQPLSSLVLMVSVCRCRTPCPSCSVSCSFVEISRTHRTWDSMPVSLLHLHRDRDSSPM